MHKACRNGALLLPFLYKSKNSPKFRLYVRGNRLSWSQFARGTRCEGAPHYCVISTSLGYFSPGMVAMTVLVAASIAESVLP